VLREKVRANYTIFLDASEGIQNVGNDMISLKELIVKTQSLVEVGCGFTTIGLHHFGC
jgi:hypothetical protein